MSSQFTRLTKVLAKSLKLDEEQLLQNFRLATSNDIAAISDLRSRVFGELIKADDLDYLHWRYFARKEFPSTLWVYQYEGQVIAALGTEPVEIWYEDHLEPALRNMDAIVEPKFDGRGLGAWMTLALQQQHDCILVTGGNENSTSMLNKLFTALPVRKNYKIILNAREYLEQKINNPFINGLLTPVANLVATLYLNLRWLSKSVPDNLSLTYFNSVEQLIPKVVNPVGCIGNIKVVRTQSYLQWRYADNPCTDYYAVGLFDEQSLIAYVIYKFEDGWGRGSTRMGQIVDWYVDQSTKPESILASVLTAAIRNLKIRGCTEVMMVLNDKLSHQAATDAGFVYRYVESKFFVHYSGATQDSKIFAADAWYQSLGDTDTV